MEKVIKPVLLEKYRDLFRKVYKKTAVKFIQEPWSPIKTKRIGFVFDDFKDLAEKQCEVIAIEKSKTNKYSVFFDCEKETHKIVFNTKLDDENKKFLLKSKIFKFVLQNNQIKIEPDNEALKTTRTSVKVQNIDNLKGKIGKCDYIYF